MSIDDYKLYAFQPSGHGEPSFFVIALTEYEARSRVDAWFSENRLDEDGEPRRNILDQEKAWNGQNYGDNYYEMTVADRGVVITNDNW